MIPRKQIEDMGFFEIQKNLFMKELHNEIRLYRDYRDRIPSSYAYQGDHVISSRQFKELRSIEIIEKKIKTSKKTLFDY